MTPARAEQFFAFAREREAIRLRKEAGQPFPWTEDQILREYKFTNVLRKHDATSRRLRSTFYQNNYHSDPRSILMNAALFRYFGTFEFAEAVGWQEYEDFDFQEIIDTAANRLSRKMRVFTGAYVITNQGISAPKQKVVVDHFLRDLHEATPELISIVQSKGRWRDVSEEMAKIKGFGGTGFMTKEILLDTMFTGMWPKATDEDGTRPDDYDEWTPVGPGALRGVKRLLGSDDVSSGLPNKEAALDVILRMVEVQNDFEPVLSNDSLYPADVQFQLCEFDKYERVRLGQGRPRSKYHSR